MARASQRASDRRFSSGDQLCRFAVALTMRGEHAAPRGIGVREIIAPTVLTLTDVHNPFMASKVRRANYRFGLAEACWILAGSDEAELIGGFNKQMFQFSDDGKRMWGAYGPRLMGQLAHVISSLKRDPDSRQAIVTTWRPMVAAPDTYPGSRHLYKAAGMHDPYADLENNPHPEWDGASWRSKDIPCTIAWHFQLRKDRLHLTVFMRSNDVWLGLPYDLLSFTTVQRVVASILGVEPGEYHHIASNLHLYDSNADGAKKLLHEVPGEAPRMPHILPHTMAGVESASEYFKVMMDGGYDACADWLGPFNTAIRREPEHWPAFGDLMAANGRARPAKP